MICLLEWGEMAKFEKYAKKFKSDSSALFLFYLALFEFLNKGDTPQSVQQLHQAMKSNSHVVPILKKRQLISDLPETYSPGSKEEAINCVFYTQRIWYTKPATFQWLIQHA